ncbi:hypothetical protein QBC38DRAFT_232515 [Podospora fimiseda]|uniref:Transglutaminase-like domain-containing protein n=1 Tax=Podospora fimiseda TaxID=252190 RepID=A0AAN7BN31_9PEZI|nr:hypothetical protein QBC38DRAFT_232515 [Podospora fimiseda]
MAEVEEPRLTTLAERIAALNQQKNFQAPPTTAASGKRPPPPPPVRAATIQMLPNTSDITSTKPSLPARPTRAVTEKSAPPPLPRRTTTHVENGGQPAPPPLRSRVSHQSTPPALPARSPSSHSALTIPTPGARRNSNSSDISHLSAISTLSLTRTKSSDASQTRNLPPPLEQAKLPPLPPTRRELEAKAKEEAANFTPSLPTRRITEPPSLPPRRPTDSPTARPSLPPRLPSRPTRSPAVTLSEQPSPALPARRLPPPPSGFQTKNSLECGFNSKTKSNGPLDAAPPPIPLSSRPSVSQIDALASRAVPSPHQTPTAGPACMICRDFSAPDNVAAQYPLASLPRSNTVNYLATNLCSQFSSPTDKARAIFAWCHHNIFYDVHSFFNKCIPRGLTIEQQIFSGLAVCEGYARIYEAIARTAGLECTLVSGHGKGFGYEPGISPSSITDRENHAWNAVRIDNGEWKLIDACWGAGHLCTATGSNLYKQEFSPEMFTMSNERFGERHFPTDPRHFYRKDGRALTFEEYIIGNGEGQEKPMFTTDATKEGLDESNFLPRQKHISVYKGQEVVRFQFARLCEHWRPEIHGRGKQYLFALKIGGVDGRKEDTIPLETDNKFWWWLDVKARDLGAPGQKISLVAFTEYDGKPGRGLTKEDFLRRKGRCGCAWTYLIQWELVA